MIDYLRGKLASLNPTTMVIDCCGVGYELNISLTSYAAYEGETGEVKAWVAEVIRDDAHLLYGFATQAERELFGRLTTVSGVGPSTARLLLSSFAPQELSAVIMLGQTDALKSVKGIGLKTAQRIVVDLKGKLSEAELTAEGEAANTTIGAATQAMGNTAEAASALKMLGFQEAAIRKVLQQIIKDEPSISVETLIKKALRKL